MTTIDGRGAIPVRDIYLELYWEDELIYKRDTAVYGPPVALIVCSDIGAA